MAYYYDGVKCDTLAELNALRQSRGAQPTVAAHNSRVSRSDDPDLPTMSAFELDTLGMRIPEVMKRGAGEDDGGFRARLSARLFALLPLQDSVTSGQPARDVTQAGPAPTVSDEVRPCVRPGCENPAGRQSVRQGVWLCEVHRGISEPAAGPARDVTQAGPAPTVSDEVRPCLVHSW